MNNAEITRRLETLTEQQIVTGINMVRGGFGAHGMTLEHTVTLKQANALHELVAAVDAGKCPHVYLPWTQAAKRCPACGAIQHHRPDPNPVLTSHPIAKAVMPLKAEAVKRAAKYAQDIITQAMMDLEVHGWDLNKVAPYPESTMRRATYMKAKRTRGMYEAFSKRVAQEGEKPWYNSSREPNIRTADPEGQAKFIKDAEADAAVQYDAFVMKLVEKVGECYGAQLEGSHVWGHSILTVWKHNQPAERWKTQTILNVSVLGKVFNQWPTRKVK